MQVVTDKKLEVGQMAQANFTGRIVKIDERYVYFWITTDNMDTVRVAVRHENVHVIKEKDGV